MKNFLYLLGLMLALCMSSCGDDDSPVDVSDKNAPTEPEPIEDLTTIKATATLDKITTRMGYEDLGTSINFQWEESDLITVCYKHEYDGIYNEWKEFGIESINNKTATFSGSFTNGELVNFPDKEWKYVWALSPAASRLEDSHWSTSVMCKTKGQKIVNGKLSLTAAYSTARALYTEASTMNFEFQPRMAVLTFKVSLPASFNKSAIKSFMLQGEGLYDTRVLNLEAPNEPYFEWKQGTENAIDVTFEGTLPIENNVLTTSIFVFPSENVKSLNLTLTDASDERHSATINSVNVLEAAARYMVSVNMNKSAIIKALEEQKLNVASIFAANGNFLGRYSLNSNNNTLDFTYFEGRTLKHASRALGNGSMDVNFDPLQLSPDINLSGLSLEKNGKIQLKGTNITNCTLMSQSNAIKDMDAYGDIHWSREKVCANDKLYETIGDAKDEFNTELENNLYVEFLYYEKRRHALYSCGITKHGDVIYTNACSSLTELCKGGEIDILQFDLDNVINSYGGGGTFPGFTSDENKASNAPQRYLEQTLPNSLAAWKHKDGLIVVKEVVNETTSYYLLSPTTDNWFKLVKK